MTRIVKVYDERFNEFLDEAQYLFFSQGYEQASVQDIIKRVGVAKGTFYHYFDSKVDLLEAVVQRNRKHILEKIMPIVEDPNSNALDKLTQFFQEIGNWKLDNHHMILNMLRMLYKDENVLLRLKMHEETRQHVAAPLAEIIQQGVREGLLNVKFAHETAELILRMCEMPSHHFVAALIEGTYDENRIEAMQRELDVFNQSIERVLGLHANSFVLITYQDLVGWLSLLDQTEKHQVK